MEAYHGLHLFCYNLCIVIFVMVLLTYKLSMPFNLCKYFVLYLDMFT